MHTGRMMMTEEQIDERVEPTIQGFANVIAGPDTEGVELYCQSPNGRDRSDLILTPRLARHLARLLLAAADLAEDAA